MAIRHLAVRSLSLTRSSSRVRACLQVLAALFFAVSLLSPPALLAQGFVSTVAGNGATAAFGENMQATSAGLAMPQGLAFDRDGNLLIADNGSRIRKVNFESGVINTVAGSTTGTPNLGFSGDGGPATSAAMLGQGIFQGVAADAQGNFYFADILNHRVRKVDANGIITTFAGTGAVFGESSLFNPHGVATDSQGNVYIADTSHSRVLKVTPSGVSATIAGTGVQGFSGDGGPATAAQLAQPCTVMVDKNGNVYIGDYGNNRVRKVNGAGIITTVAGNGSVLFTGDGGPGPSAGVSLPLGMAMDNAGNLYIADNGHDRIRKVDTAGIITTYVGSGEPVAGFEDGKEATQDPAVRAQRRRDRCQRRSVFLRFRLQSRAKSFVHKAGQVADRDVHVVVLQRGGRAGSIAAAIGADRQLVHAVELYDIGDGQRRLVDRDAGERNDSGERESRGQSGGARRRSL